MRGAGLTAVVQAYTQRRDYPGEAVDIDDLPTTLEDWTAFKGEVDAVAAAAREVAGLATKHIIALLGDQGHARFGVTFYKVSDKRTVKIKREAHSRFWNWVKAHDLAPRLFNPNDARITGLAAMRALPDPETGEVMERKEWDEIFIEYIAPSADLKLEEIPESKMKQWQRRLPDGTIQRGGPIEEGDTNGRDNDEDEEPAG